MPDLIESARDWARHDPDPVTRVELEDLVEAGQVDALAARLKTTLTFGTAGIRGAVGAGPGRMNRAVIIRTTHGLATYLISADDGPPTSPVVIGFDARPHSRQFAEDTAGVLVAAGISVIYFPEAAPTPLVAYAARHLHAAAAVVVTASHNPKTDNGYKVYGSDASQIVSPVDSEIQAEIEKAPPADEVPRVEEVFSGHLMATSVPENIVDCYWEEVDSHRSRHTGSSLHIVYTPLHGVGKDTVFEVMERAGHTGITAVPEQAVPDGTFPTVDFPNPEEPGTLDLAMRLASEEKADVVMANDPDADRLAAVIPTDAGWRPLSGNEVGVMLGDYILANTKHPEEAIVASSIVSSPMLASIARSYGARHEMTLTGFKWIVKAGLTLEGQRLGRFVFGYEEALGYTVGSTVRDKDGISAAILFADLLADLADARRRPLDYLHELWAAHGLWVSAQVSMARSESSDLDSLQEAVTRLADDPPSRVGDESVTHITDYRSGADQRPPWLGSQALVELTLGDRGRVLIRPSGTEPKLKIYVDLTEPLGPDADAQHKSLREKAETLGHSLSQDLAI